MARNGGAAMIRQCRDTDMGMVLDMARDLHAAGKFPGAYEADHFAGYVRRMDGFVSDRGAILGVVTPSMWNPGVINATEGFWWAEDGNGVELLRHFERMAREKGANRVVMGTQMAYRQGAVGRVLEREGYEATEVYYARSF